SVTPTSAEIQEVLLVFHNLQIKGSGEVIRLGEKGVSPETKLTLQSNTVELKPWVDLIPPLKDFDLSGSFTFQAKAQGPADRLNYSAEVKIQDWSARAPMLKVAPRLNGVVQVKTDQVEKISFKLTAPGTEVSWEGQVRSFTKPQASFSLRSPGIDLDQWVDWNAFKKDADAGTQASVTSSDQAQDSKKKTKAAGKKAGQAENLDASLEP